MCQQNLSAWKKETQEQGHKDFQIWHHNWCNILAHSMHEKEGLTQLFLFGNNQLGRLLKIKIKNPLVINFIIKVINMPLIINLLDF